MSLTYLPNLAAERLKKRQQKRETRLKPPAYWSDWLTTLFPTTYRADFADRHTELWEWVETIRLGVKPTPSAFIAIWGRGGAKSTTVEGATVRLGAEERRKFALYIRGTQDKANESVGNIAALMESNSTERYYPKMATRHVGKYGNSKGWRVDMLRCGNGFNVIGLGLDAAVRGVKIEEFRPDLIIFDDIDDIQDSVMTVQKKINVITKSILPSGSNDVAYLGCQNLIHPNSIFSSFADGTADFLYDRIVSGPHNAVIDLTYEARPAGGYRITGGLATWAGQPLEVCEAQINEWGLSSFLQEAQHEVDDPPGGIWDHIEFRHCQWADVPDLVRGCVWVDPAVTDTDQSDSMGIQADGIAADDTIYRLYSWEQRTSPVDALRRAILKALELKFDTLGIETDQGGDTWSSVYKEACQSLTDDPDYPDITKTTRFPVFTSAKAGQGHGSKVHRNSQMLHDYERGRVIHVIGTHKPLEKALKRFPRTKPFDLTDAAYWSWYDLRKSRGWARGMGA